jgi:YD repeat-containing protein
VLEGTGGMSRASCALRLPWRRARSLVDLDARDQHSVRELPHVETTRYGYDAAGALATVEHRPVL